MSKKPQHRNINMLVLLTFSFVVVMVIGVRTFQLSVGKQSNGIDLVEYQPNEIERSSITSVNRGTIFDRNGKPIAMDTTSYSIYAVLNDGDPTQNVQDPDQTAAILAKHLKMEPEKILQALHTQDVYQVEFGSGGKNLSKEEKQTIEAEKLPGIFFKEDRKRHYVNDYFASHIIGYANMNHPDSEDIVDVQHGHMGFEAIYDKELNGLDTEDSVISDGQALGQDLYTTLDARLQNMMDEALIHAYKEYQPENMMAYLVKVDTGEVLVASQQPTFNLNTLEGIDQEWKNLLVEDSFEPGSTIKILTLASAYDQGLYQPQETFLSGKVDVYDQTVRDYNLYGWGNITYEKALVHSSNVGMIKLIEKMGLKRWQEELQRFGFGKVTESIFSNEVAGNLNFDNPVNGMMSGFGQGLTVTPIQLLEAFSAIGNQGKTLQLQWTKGIGSNSPVQAQEKATLFKPATAQHLLETMVQVVEDPQGTGQEFKHPEISIAAKTGTAQIPNPEGNGYMTGSNDYVYSVVTFFPAEQPEYMMYLAMKRPSNPQQKSGTKILSEIFVPFVDQVMITSGQDK